MWLLLLLTFVDFGSSLVTEKMCYGKDYDFPSEYTPPEFDSQIFYQPRGESPQLVVNDGESKHKRFKVSPDKIIMQDLTEQDNGTFLLVNQEKTIKFLIYECQEPQTSYYGSLGSLWVPSGAKYLEFSQTPPSGVPRKPEIIWKRGGPSYHRGSVKGYYYVFENLNKNDSGYYRFRRSNDELITWIRLNVEELYRYIYHLVGEDLDIDIPVHIRLLYISFTPMEYEKYETERVFHRSTMDRRIEIAETYFSIRELRFSDAGTYKFIDENHDLAMRVELEVIPVTPVWIYVVIIGGVVLGILLCCCCIRKCCCKKSSSKRSTPDTETAPPSVYYHGQTPSQPVVPLLSREPRIISPAVSTNTAGSNMDPPPPPTQVTDTGRLGPVPTNYDTTTSNDDPKFELKGTPSAPPLSCDTYMPDVYTSDKLNFL